MDHHSANGCASNLGWSENNYENLLLPGFWSSQELRKVNTVMMDYFGSWPSLLLLYLSRHSKSNVRKSNSIELNPWIEFDWVRQSNEIEHHTFSEFDFRTNRIQSNKSNSIELNPSDCVRLSSETELNQTQLNGFRSRDYRMTLLSLIVLRVKM